MDIEHTILNKNMLGWLNMININSPMDQHYCMFLKFYNISNNNVVKCQKVPFNDWGVRFNFWQIKKCPYEIWI